MTGIVASQSERAVSVTSNWEQWRKELHVSSYLELLKMLK